MSDLAIEALTPLNFAEVTHIYGSLQPLHDSLLFVRVYRKAKANVVLPHIQKREQQDKSDSDSDSDSDDAE